MAATIDYFLFWLPFWVDFFPTPSLSPFLSLSVSFCASSLWLLPFVALEETISKRCLPSIHIYILHIYTLYMYLYL